MCLTRIKFRNICMECTCEILVNKKIKKELNQYQLQIKNMKKYLKKIL